MKHSRAFFRFVPAIVIVAATLAACGGSAPSRFYTLSPMASGKPVRADAVGLPRVVVGIGAVEIPDYLDRPQIVTRTSQHQLTLAEFDQWGGSLKADVNRVLLEDLARTLPADRFSVVILKRGILIDYKITLCLVRLDVEPGQGAVLEAQWAISDRDGKGDGRMRSTRLSEPVATGDITEAVGAMSRALGRLSEEIAAGILASAK